MQVADLLTLSRAASAVQRCARQQWEEQRSCSLAAASTSPAVHASEACGVFLLRQVFCVVLCAGVICYFDTNFREIKIIHIKRLSAESIVRTVETLAAQKRVLLCPVCDKRLVHIEQLVLKLSLLNSDSQYDCEFRSLNLKAIKTKKLFL
jgi:hypothetical protein